MLSKLSIAEILASRDCQRCRHPFMPTHRLLSCCPACAQIQHEEQAQQQKEEGVRIEADRRRRRWEEFCPALYRESDPARLPSALLTAVADYRYGARGLGFVGESGLGKTRAMMRLCGRFILEEDRRGEYVTGTAFSREVAERGHEVGAYTKRLRQPGFVFLDDVSYG